MTKRRSAELSRHLTMQETGFPVAGPGGRLIGIVVKTGNDRFAAWAPKRIGDFASATEAENAVRAARKTGKAGART